MTEQPKPRNWDDWRKHSGWSKTGTDEPFTFPKGEDELSFYLTEDEWVKVRYAIQFYIQELEGSNHTTELIDIVEIFKKLATGNWAGFRLSRDRAVSFKSTVIGHPGLTDCCHERMFRVSQSARWRCYGCGRML